MSKVDELREELAEYGITNICRCSCGAYTVTINGVDYSVHKRNFQKYFSVDKELFQKYIKKIISGEFYGCNWCVNSWGLDLYGCGSGELFKKCDNHHKTCRQPMQSIEDEYNHVRSAGSWI